MAGDASGERQGKGKGSSSVAEAEATEQPAAAASRGPLACCRRRSPEEQDRETQQRYRELILKGRNISEKQRYWYDKLCWWSDVPTKEGSRIFVLAPRGPKGQTDYPIDMWEFMAYCLTKLHDHVVTEQKKFAIVWVQMNDHRLWPLDLRRLKGSLHPSYLKHLEAVHVVHPSWTVRVLRILLWPIAEDELWDRFFSHERIEFLDPHIDPQKFRLPKDIYEYDKWLDKQAQEMNHEAAKRFGGGSTGMFGGEEDKKVKEQMDAMKHLLEERGYGGDKDSKLD